MRRMAARRVTVGGSEAASIAQIEGAMPRNGMPSAAADARWVVRPRSPGTCGIERIGGYKC